MANINIRATFALDKATKIGLGKLAHEWSVSQSEALRRAVADSLQQIKRPNRAALRALQQLRQSQTPAKQRQQANADLSLGWQSWADRLQRPKTRRGKS